MQDRPISSPIVVAMSLILAVLGLSHLPLALADPPAGTRSYTVEPGDSLRRIAAKELGDVRHASLILELNPQVKNENRIQHGQVLILPAIREGRPVSDARSSSDPRPEGRVEELRLDATDADADRPWDQQIRDLAEQGIPALGLAGVVGVALLAELLVYLLVGAIFLWLGAALTAIPESGFGRCFGVHTQATLLSWFTALALAVGLGAGAWYAVDRGVLSGELERWLLPGFLAFGTVLGTQLLVYVMSVRRGFEVGFVRAGFACFLAAGLQVGIGVGMGLVFTA